MLWRHYKTDTFAAAFLIVFVAVRVSYHSSYFIPFKLVRNCSYGVTFFLALPYVTIQAFFVYKILMKIINTDHRSKRAGSKISLNKTTSRFGEDEKQIIQKLIDESKAHSEVKKKKKKNAKNKK